MKKIVFSVFCSLLMIVNVSALDIYSKYAVLYNLNDDEVIYELNKDERTSIASLTKIMTTLVAIENISDYNGKVTIKSSMFTGLAEENAAVIGLRNNQEVTYNDLLYGLFLGSGADAARALAISIAGSEDKFVELMNVKASELNLQNTNYTNTIGLDDDEHYSTVDDVATLLKIAYQNEKFREIFTTESYVFSDQSLIVTSTFRKTAKTYGPDPSYILGAKTGYTYDAGRCLASIALDEENQITYLLVTTNAESIYYPVKDAITIYNHYFENYKYYKLIEKGDLLITIPTRYSDAKEINFYAEKDIQKYLHNDLSDYNVTLQYEGEKVITPSMEANSTIGSIQVIYQNEVIDTIDIILTSKISFSLVAFIIANKFIFIVIGILIILAIEIIRRIKKKKYNKKKKIVMTL